MAPRLQVELAFGVLIASGVTGLHPAAQGELSLGESQRGLGTCLKQSLLERRVPRPQEVNLGWDIWRQSSQGQIGGYIDRMFGRPPLCPQVSLDKSGASHSHEDLSLEAGDTKSGFIISRNPPTSIPLTQLPEDQAACLGDQYLRNL